MSYTAAAVVSCPDPAKESRIGAAVRARSAFRLAFSIVAAASRSAGFEAIADSTAGRIASTRPAGPGQRVPVSRALWLRYRAAGGVSEADDQPDAENRRAVFRLARPLSSMKLPATRTMKSSPGPSSRISSGTTRESEQLTITAKGCCPSALGAADGIVAVDRGVSDVPGVPVLQPLQGGGLIGGNGGLRFGGRQKERWRRRDC